MDGRTKTQVVLALVAGLAIASGFVVVGYFVAERFFLRTQDDPQRIKPKVLIEIGKSATSR